jgi:hypothetical protein
VVIEGQTWQHLNHDERCEYILEMIQSTPAPTLQQIGDRFGMTREWARQLIRAHGWVKPSAYNGTKCQTCGLRYNAPDVKEHRATLAHERAKAEHRRAMGDEKRDWDMGALIYALHKAGYTNIEITEAAGVALSYPYRWLTWLGEDPYLYGRGPLEHTRLNPQRAAERDRQVVMAYAEGVDRATILEAFDLNPGNLQRIIQAQKAKRPEWYRAEMYRRIGEKGSATRKAQREARRAEMSDKP